MKKKIHPAFAMVIIAVTLAGVLYFGFKTALAPPRSVIGINRDGSEMTREQADALANAMKPKSNATPAAPVGNAKPTSSAPEKSSAAKQ